MSATASLLQSIRTILRQRAMTYRQLAVKLNLSEPTVKRDLSRGNFSLSRLDAICSVLDISLPELLHAPNQILQTNLSETQERAFVRDRRLLLVRYLLINECKWSEITATFELDDSRVAPEFLRARFDAPAEELRFIGGMLSASSKAYIKAGIERLAQEFDELAHRDARLPLDAKDGCSALLALRQWEFSQFTQLRRRVAKP